MELDVAYLCDSKSQKLFLNELQELGFNPDFIELQQIENTAIDACPKVLFLASKDIKQAANLVYDRNLIFDLLVTRSDRVRDYPDLLARCGSILSYPWKQSTLGEALTETLVELDDIDSLSSALAANFIGSTEPVQNLLRVIDRVARYDAPVLVTGETGTGKELVARGIHYESKRCDYPFVPVNCGALNDELLISELFGHESGAFTDAKKHRVGLVEQAYRGSLFLDEVDSLSIKAQSSLLRFLQDQEYRPLGGDKVLRSDVRIICATNTDLLKQVDKGLFREDLFYRLKILDVHTPSLRERRQDIAVLIDHFLVEVGRKYGEGKKRLHPLTERWMVNEYDWPGNVRELENYVHRIFILSKSKTIYVPDVLGLPINFRLADRRQREGSVVQIGCFREAKASHISKFEQEYLSRLMKYAAGNVSEAARIAGKERRALGKMLKKYGIAYQSYRKDANRQL